MSISKLLFGEIALKKKLVTQEQVSECLEIQKKLKEMGINRTLGAVMHDKKYLSMVEIKEILREMTGTKDWNAIEGYEILGKLGKGGMGAVYKARHQKLNKIVALKVLPPDLAGDQEYLDRFLREAQAAAKLNHVNIVQALDVGESYGYHYFVMEYAEGKTVKDLIEHEGTIEDAATLDILEQMASALAHASKNDLVHRDIKPSNIIVNSEGVAKLLDLGLAKSITEDQTITQTGVIMGTPFYLSPEQARSEDLDARSDIYSLGVTAFHMVTGQVPFSGNSAATILYKHIFQDPPKARTLNPKVAAPVSEFIARLMAKSKDDRPTPEQCVDEIQGVREKAGLQRKAKGMSGERGASAASLRPATGAAAEKGRALDNTLAASQGAATKSPELSGAVTADQSAIQLDVSGPQSAATPEGRTEEISAPDTKRRTRTPAAGEITGATKRAAVPAPPAPKLSHVRQLVAAGAAACVLAVCGLVANATIPEAQPGDGEGARPGAGTAHLHDHEQVSREVAEGIERAEQLRKEKKLREAIAELADVSAQAAKGGRRLEVADEIALARARGNLLDDVKQRAEQLTKQYEETAAQNQDTDPIVAQITSLDLKGVVKLVEDERRRLESEKKGAPGQK